ncbi:sodium transport system permease protein [Neorhodopirellula lusitana]|uniref:Sodium transport system permease protein n=1 Tax=Neorhodopirellula lusitana TaxID=445327 RepID=A0ABY1Q2L7_9BACT|nr:ABC transporter permease subunit/CPBP intramembrane protease [Neorhodopirellula lusitana]SMP55994.1 sodium transport system permease protein [Neorhodopirellula lusitana]
MSESSKQKRRAAMRAGRPRLSAIKLIYTREMRDQLRDRRTLFTIAVLPMLLYPLVGMLLLQIAQFTRQHTISVCVVGLEHVSGESSDVARQIGVEPLLVPVEADDSDSLVAKTDDQSASETQADRKKRRVLGKIHDGSANDYQFSSSLWETESNIDVFAYRADDLGSVESLGEKSQRWVRDQVFDCVVCVTRPLGHDSETPQSAAAGTDGEVDDAAGAAVGLYYNVASDQSMVAKDRVTSILNRWRGTWVRSRLSNAGVNLTLLDPFKINDVDIAPERTREAAFWSKLLPFIMLVWAMTGAFYPAIDLVAGEKERGTLETLLCSPALRGEIVWGKLGAVMTFSMMTAILNASSMLVTSTFVFNQIGVGPGGASMGSPPIVPMLWLLVALVPLSALFSALALAVAAMARSSKEGQYYLMPLMMVTLPLVLLPMLPGTTLNLGTSLIPVTGMFLLVRSLVEGHHLEALTFLPSVLLMTTGCLFLATRWARRQFESEAVLFGDGDQWELGAWMRHLWRDRQRAATPSIAYGCGAIILVALFFGKLAVTEMPDTFEGIAMLIFVPQIGLILAPTLLMATMMTTSLKSSLRLTNCPWRTWSLVAVLAVMLHPLYLQLASLVSHMYPLSPQALEAMRPFGEHISAASWVSVLLLMAALPAVCEELAFRGFIFGGLVRNNSPVRAVLVTAIMFGLSHGVLQQSISASFMGVLLGWIALRTGSVLPGILIHFGNNALSVSMMRIAELDLPLLKNLLSVDAVSGAPQYHWIWTGCALFVSAACVVGIYRTTHALDTCDSNDALADRLVSDQPVLDPSLKRLATN